MRAFQENLSRLEAADTQVLGVSVDSPFANFQFAQQNGISFPLLSDMSGNVLREYGLERRMDIKGVPVTTARRATFLIGKNGKILETSVDSEAVDPSKIVAACERRKKG